VIAMSRKKDESVIIDDDIILTVIEVLDDKVRLGIEIPRGGTAHRREVYEAILSPKQNQVTELPSPPQTGGNR
jgi:carbon storage regulator